MSPSRGLILLDRDGVLNQVVIDPEQGTIDSPLHPNQVLIFPEVPQLLFQLNRMGYGLAIVTNQPAAAKGKTTRRNLEDVHTRILQEVQSEGGSILSSHICFHRSEDECGCRKPKTGLLEEALSQNPGFDSRLSWIVGDGITDVQAGQKMALKTAFLGPKKCDSCKILEHHELTPDFWGNDLRSFVEYIMNPKNLVIAERFGFDTI